MKAQLPIAVTMGESLLKFQFSALFSALVFASSLLNSCCAFSDQFTWLGNPGSWTDPNNWINPNDPVSVNYPGASDTAIIHNSSNISLDGSQIVMALDVSSGPISFSSGSLQVTGQNLFRVGAGGFGGLTLQSGASVTANGTVIGLDSTGDVTIDGGSLTDNHELDVGYSAVAALSLFDGGTATATGPVFLGGFSAGNGHVDVSGSGAKLSANGSFIAVGNLGNGTLSIDEGGGVTAAGDFYVAGFAGSSGTATLNDNNSKLQVAGTMYVGTAGTGSLTINSGATATAKAVDIGNSAGSHGLIALSQSGAMLTVTGGPFSIGNQGTGELDINSGAQVNVQGNGSFVVVGSAASGAGTLLVEGSGSKLVVNPGALEVGRSGTAQLHVLDGASIDSQGLYIGSGNGAQTNTEINGSGSFIQAHSEAVIGSAGNATLALKSGGALLSQTGSLATGGDGAVTIDGAGSKWQVNNQLNIGSAHDGSVTITGGGNLSASSIQLAVMAGSSGTLTLEGANSQFIASQVQFGAGKGQIILQHGATHVFGGSGPLNIRGAPGTALTVQDNGSHAQILGSLNIGSDPSTPGRLSVNSGGSVALTGGFSAYLNYGGIDVGAHSSLSIEGSLVAGDNAGQANIIVTGTGATLTAAGRYVELGPGETTLSISDGAAVEGHDFIVGFQGEILVSGASTLSANNIDFSDSFRKFSVSDASIVAVTHLLNMGRATLFVNNLGTVIVGRIPSGVRNFVNVGPGGEFHSASSVPNILNLGGIVQAGNSPGVLNVSGDYIQASGALLRFNIDGADPGTGYSQLVVGGNLQLAGTLRFVFENGFTPTAGQKFDVIQTAGSAQLDNVQIQIQNLAPGFQYTFLPITGGYELTALNSGIYLQQFIKGDFNGDRAVTSADIGAMLQALTDLSAYQQSRSMTFADLLGVGDLDGSGDVTNADIQPLLNLVGGNGSLSSVPEPSAFALLAIGGILLHRTRRWCVARAGN